MIADFEKTSKHELNLHDGDLVEILEKNQNGESPPPPPNHLKDQQRAKAGWRHHRRSFRHVKSSIQSSSRLVFLLAAKFSFSDLYFTSVVMIENVLKFVGWDKREN